MKPCHKRLIFAVVAFCLVIPAKADEISVRIPTVSASVAVNPQGAAQFTGDGFQYLAATGEPRIPYQVARILLPPEAALGSVVVSVRSLQMENIPGQWDVIPTPPAGTWRQGNELIVWPDNKRIVNGKDTGIYERDEWFPREITTNLISGRLRAWQLAGIPVALYQYNPVRKLLRRLKSAELLLTFTVNAGLRSLPLRDANAFDVTGEETVRQLAVNFSQISPLYRRPVSVLRTIQPVYLILTTRQVVNNSVELPIFVQSKRQQGFRVAVVTEDTWGGGTGDAAAENIRRWLRNTYMRISSWRTG